MKKVWIIGFSSGIGLELLLLYVENNYKVIASSRNAKNSKELLKLKSSYRNNLHLVDIDVSNNQSVIKA